MNDWWKEVPCHFTWDLEKGISGSKYTSILNSLDSKLADNDDARWKDPVCDLLLFRGYIEVSKLYGVKHNPRKALEYFLRSEEEAVNVTDDEERRAYLTVSYANRLWVLDTFNEPADSTRENERNRLLAGLEEMWLGHRKKVPDNFYAYMSIVEGFALARLGPNKVKDAEMRYRRAVKIINSKASWYHTIGQLILRQSHAKTSTSTVGYDDINDEIRCYEKAVELDPTNDTARCDLALALIKTDRKAEAEELISQVKDTSSQVIIKKGRFYKRIKEHRKALDVLMEGEKLTKPRGELFFQIALCYSALRKMEKHNARFHKEQVMRYLNKCIELDSTHFYAQMERAFEVRLEGKFEEALMQYRKLIVDFKECPNDCIEAKNGLAECLFHGNRNKMSEEVAKAYEDVVEDALNISKTTGLEPNNSITKKQGFLAKAKMNLTKYYSYQRDDVKLQQLHYKLWEMGYQD